MSSHTLKELSEGIIGKGGSELKSYVGLDSIEILSLLEKHKGKKYAIPITKDGKEAEVSLTLDEISNKDFVYVMKKHFLGIEPSKKERVSFLKEKKEFETKEGISVADIMLNLSGMDAKAKAEILKKLGMHTDTEKKKDTSLDIEKIVKEAKTSGK